VRLVRHGALEGRDSGLAAVFACAVTEAEETGADTSIAFPAAFACKPDLCALDSSMLLGKCELCALCGGRMGVREAYFNTCR
jgi:hypothetical protein